MRNYRSSLIAVAILVAVGGTAVAQAGAGAGQGRRGQRQVRARAMSLTAIPVKTLDALVTLTADQKTKVEAVQKQFASDAKALRPGKGETPSADSRAKIADLTKKATEDINAILTDAQKETLKTAMKGLAPLRTMGIPPALAIELKLTADQKQQIAAKAKEVAPQLRGLEPTARRAKLAEVREQVLQMLTDDQKKIAAKFREEQAKRRGQAGERRRGSAGAGAGTPPAP